MQRRQLLGWGGAAALATLLVGAGANGLTPALGQGGLTPAGEGLVSAVARAMLQGSLPEEGPDAATELAALGRRFEDLVQGLPAHTQGEVHDLLAALIHPLGCLALCGQRLDWSRASRQEVQSVLGDMQGSTIGVRRQAYLALHDLIGGAYFAAPHTWTLLGYPGPVAV